MALPQRDLNEKQCLVEAQIYKKAVQWLEERGVTPLDMASLVYEIQKQYLPGISIDDCLECVNRVLTKREVQNAILTGLTLDTLAEKGLIDEPLLSIIQSDDGLYGIDEILALSIVNIYGSIGLTNFGYLDKVKPGVISKLNEAKDGHVNTFIDDIVAAIVAAAAGRLSHRSRGVIAE